MKKTTKINYLELIPRHSAKEIHEKINQVVSIKQVRRILKGESFDSYGIIDLAIKEASKLSQKQKKQAKQALKLQSKIVSPPNTNTK